MDFHGNINLKDNEMQGLVMQQEQGFPVDAVAGSVVFNDNTLYMAVALNDVDPIWIPLTSTIDTYVHEQESASTTWTITHSIGEENMLVQVFDENRNMIIPDTVTPTDTDELVITFSTVVAGRAILMHGDEVPANGVGILTPSLAPGLLFTLDNPNAFDTSAGDNFGYSVAVSSTRTIVSARDEGDAGGLYSGKAYVYNNFTGALLYTLDNPNAFGTSEGDSFGAAVAISSTYAVVGAYVEGDAGGALSGKVYMFNVSTGALVHTLDNPNVSGTSTGDRFGQSIAISDDYVVVGVELEDALGLSSGTAYVFDVSTGSLVYTLEDPSSFGTSEGDRFGSAVGINGTHILVGASGEDDAGGLASGKAYVFSAATGALVHTLDNPNAVGTSANDQFGFSGSMSDNYIIIGAMQEDDSGSNSGKAYIYDVSTGALLHTLDNPNAFGTTDNDTFGQTVAISDTHAVVGTIAEDDIGGLSSGKIYVFDVVTGALVHTFDNPNAFDTSAGDQFSYSVAVSSDRVISSARSEDDAGGLNSGKVYIYSI